MQRAGELGALICMHAENGIPIDILVQQALAKGHTAPIYHALTRPADRRGRGHVPRDLPRRDGGRAGLHGAPLRRARARSRSSRRATAGCPVFAETCPQYLFLSQDDLRGDPATSRARSTSARRRSGPQHMHEDLWRGLRTYDLQVVSTDHCPFCMKEQKELGARQLREDPERHARRRDAHVLAVGRRRARRDASR